MDDLYDELMKLDFELIRELPEDGSELGLAPLGATVNRLKREPKFEGIGPDQLAGRLRWMKTKGLVLAVKTLPLSNGLGWQRTPTGKALLDRFDSDRR